MSLKNDGSRAASRPGGRDADGLWYRVAEDSVVINIHAAPGAKRNSFAGLHADALRVRLAAPANEGKANKALVEFLATSLGVPVAEIDIEVGHRSRRKRVRVHGVRASAVAALAQKT